jgi:hypothetical protein
MTLLLSTNIQYFDRWKRYAEFKKQQESDMPNSIYTSKFIVYVFGPTPPFTRRFHSIDLQKKTLLKGTAFFILLTCRKKTLLKGTAFFILLTWQRIEAPIPSFF